MHKIYVDICKKFEIKPATDDFKVIKKAYLKLVLANHPDKHPVPYSSVLMLDPRARKPSQIEKNILQMKLTGGILTAYWSDNSVVKEKPLAVVDRFRTIIQQLPQPNAYSENKELIKNIILEYGCTHDETCKKLNADWAEFEQSHEELTSSQSVPPSSSNKPSKKTYTAHSRTEHKDIPKDGLRSFTNEEINIFIPVCFIQKEKIPDYKGSYIVLSRISNGQENNYELDQITQALNELLKDSTQVGVTYEEAAEIANQHSFHFPKLIVELTVPFRFLDDERVSEKEKYGPCVVNAKDGEYFWLAQNTIITKEMIISIQDFGMMNTRRFRFNEHKYWPEGRKITFSQQIGQPSNPAKLCGNAGNTASTSTSVVNQAAQLTIEDTHNNTTAENTTITTNNDESSKENITGISNITSNSKTTVSEQPSSETTPHGWSKYKILGLGALIFAGVCVTAGALLSFLSVGTLSPAGFLLGSLGFKLGLTGLALLSVDAAVCLAGAALVSSIPLAVIAINDCKNGGVKEPSQKKDSVPYVQKEKGPDHDPHCSAYGGFSLLKEKNKGQTGQQVTTEPQLPAPALVGSLTSTS
jgi:hypothetical protein